MDRGNMHPSAAMEDPDEGSSSSSSCRELGTDVLVKILLRLPPNPRRRLRLVCRQWRDAVDTRTATDLRMRSRAKTLLVGEGSMYVLDGRWSRRPVMASGNDRMAVVGTCNGLLCLCDNAEPPGVIALANRVTGEKLALPPLPCAAAAADVVTRYSESWHRAYGFAYSQATGQYKVVHVPCCFDRAWEFDAVQVLTVGEACWRDVAVVSGAGAGAGAIRCSLDAAIVAVDGTAYWVVADGTGKIMAFDLGDECVRSIKAPPVMAARPGS